MGDRLDIAVSAGQDPAAYARDLARARDAALSGAPVPAATRRAIRESWDRTAHTGLDPDVGRDVELLPFAEVERRRRASGLGDVLPALEAGLLSVADEAVHIMVVVDAHGTVLWRQGSSAVLRGADRLGFQHGACWDEPTVGTNAIGTALVVRRPIQVHATEHYVKTHHPWTCAAAPIHDPRSGTLLGVIDVSGPASTVHASTLALVDAVTRLAENQLRIAHHAELERVRTVAVPLMAKLRGPALATDRFGWVAAATGTAPVDRISLPDCVADGSVWLPAYGTCSLEPIPGGWLVHLADDEPQVATRVELDVRQPGHARLVVTTTSDRWEYNLSPRHAEILRALARHRAGRTAGELANDLFGDGGNTVTVRAEMSRLRRHLGAVLDHRPYRFADYIDVHVVDGRRASLGFEPRH